MEKYYLYRIDEDITISIFCVSCADVLDDFFIPFIYP